MSHVADRFVVILDANVLYPFRMKDALLRFCEAGLFRARWSETIINEWKQSLISKRPDFLDSINSQSDAMERAFPEACVSGYEDLIDSIVLPDPDDRHVVAAAIIADAEHIITENLKDFPPDCIEKYGIEAVSADDFLTSTFELYPGPATSALRKMRQSYKKPIMGPSEFLYDLQLKAMPKLASLARKNIDII